MKNQILFSRKNEKNISNCRLLKVLPACKVFNAVFALLGHVNAYSYS